MNAYSVDDCTAKANTQFHDYDFNPAAGLFDGRFAILFHFGK